MIFDYTVKWRGNAWMLLDRTIEFYKLEPFSPIQLSTFVNFSKHEKDLPFFVFKDEIQRWSATSSI